jgi:hypothetical protein
MADENHPVESYQYLYKGDNVGDIPRFWNPTEVCSWNSSFVKINVPWAPTAFVELAMTDFCTWFLESQNSVKQDKLLWKAGSYKWQLFSSKGVLW